MDLKTEGKGEKQFLSECRKEIIIYYEIMIDEQCGLTIQDLLS